MNVASVELAEDTASAELRAQGHTTQVIVNARVCVYVHEHAQAQALGVGTELTFSNWLPALSPSSKQSPGY